MYMLKCDAVAKEDCNNGCGGGLMTNAYNYLMKFGGLEEEKAYPYTGKQGECKFSKDKIAVRVANFTKIPFDEKQIAANLVMRGPLASTHFIIFRARRRNYPIFQEFRHLKIKFNRKSLNLC